MAAVVARGVERRQEDEVLCYPVEMLLLLTLACAPTKVAPSDTGGPDVPVAHDDSGSTTHDPRDTAIEQVGAAEVDDEGCNVLYAQDRLPIFELEISAGEWAGLQADYASGVEQHLDLGRPGLRYRAAGLLSDRVAGV